MSHQVLARKWRPQSFDDLVGQAHVVQALSNALEQGRLHHAYLLTGTRGVGKTTIARILARCFNCDQGLTATPCGECESCLEITQGRSIDLLEIDAASRTKVEEMRELLDNTQFAPSRSRYKIYLIDEVHMLSNSSFNALLKTLEEPPPHVIFIFATTHPQKIPPTVLSRCLQFHLKNLSVDALVEHLQNILTAEGVKTDQPALRIIAKAASGSVRDALSLTDQAIAHGDGSINESAVREMLGVVDNRVVLELVEALQADDAKKALAIVAAFVEQAADPAALIDEMMLFFHRMVVEQVIPESGAEGELHAQAISQFAKSFSPEELQLFYQSALHGKRDMIHAPDPLTGLEMTILRLFAFRQLRTDTAIAHSDDPSATQSGAAAVKKPEAAVAANPAPEPLAGQDIHASVTTEQVKKENSASLNASVEDTQARSLDLSALDNSSWCEIFSTLPLTGVVRSVGSNCLLAGVALKASPVQLQLCMREADAVLYKPEYRERLASGLQIYFEQPLSVAIEIAAEWPKALQGLETPADYRARKQEQLQKQRVKVLEDDENVKKMLDVFDAKLDTESITGS